MKKCFFGWLISICCCFYLLVLLWRVDYSSSTATTVIQRDTIVIRDTVTLTIERPIYITQVRTDTIVRDTTITVISRDSVIIPIVQKTFSSEDYKAIIEGYKPELVSLEIYPKTTTITNTITNTVKRNSRWALTGGVGVGMTRQGVQPYVGISFGYVLWQH